MSLTDVVAAADATPSPNAVPSASAPDAIAAAGVEFEGSLEGSALASFADDEVSESIEDEAVVVDSLGSPAAAAPASCASVVVEASALAEAFESVESLDVGTLAFPASAAPALVASADAAESVVESTDGAACDAVEAPFPASPLVDAADASEADAVAVPDALVSASFATDDADASVVKFPASPAAFCASPAAVSASAATFCASDSLDAVSPATLEAEASAAEVAPVDCASDEAPPASFPVAVDESVDALDESALALDAAAVSSSAIIIGRTAARRSFKRFEGIDCSVGLGAASKADEIGLEIGPISALTNR